MRKNSVLRNLMRFRKTGVWAGAGAFLFLAMLFFFCCSLFCGSAAPVTRNGADSVYRAGVIADADSSPMDVSATLPVNMAQIAAPVVRENPFDSWRRMPLLALLSFVAALLGMLATETRRRHRDAGIPFHFQQVLHNSLPVRAGPLV